MNKIVITGSESSGKSTLSQRLALHYQIPFVREMARDYLKKFGLAYTFNDLEKIARCQVSEEQNIADNHPSFLLCDTDLLTIKIWSEFRFNKCAPYITKLLENSLPNLYLLCAADLPWQDDPMRENKENREEIHELYEQNIRQSKVPFVLIYGNEENRFRLAVEAIDAFNKH